MKIIDFRFRPNTPEIINGIKNSSMFKATCEAIGFDKRVPQPLPEIVADLDRRGVELCVVSGRDCETTYGFPANNNSILEFCRAYPNKFLGFWGIDPHKGMDAIDELKLMVENHGFRGAAIDPFLAKIPANHAKYYPIYAKCCELKVPVVISTGPGTRVPGAIMGDASPARVDEVARDFPDLTIVMSHGGYPYVQEACMVCHRNANVYMEWSEYETWPFADGYVKAGNELIPDKLIFASAHPFYDSWERAKLYETLGFKPDVLENVLYNNAARVLGLA